MSRILITSGPTREYLDPVRYLTNASSGRMGAAIAGAAIRAGHEVVVVSGPVEVEYPDSAKIVPVLSTQEMLEACQGVFPTCDGLIGAAAPCDYRPLAAAGQKIKKAGRPLLLELAETPDILARLSASKGDRWMVAFALETEDRRRHALEKLQRKHCELIVLNGPEAIQGPETQVEVMDPSGDIVACLVGAKEQVADGILRIIEERLIRTA